MHEMTPLANLVKKRQYEQRIREVEHSTFYTIGVVNKRRNEQSSNDIFQATCSNAEKEKGGSLQQNDGMSGELDHQLSREHFMNPLTSKHRKVNLFIIHDL